MDEKIDKNTNSGQEKSSNSGKELDNTNLFSHLGISDKNFLFQYKKTEKILAALYLVTNFLPNQEPLRWEVRELGLNLLSSVMSLKDALPSQKDELCTMIKTIVLEMISLLEIAYFAGFISAMNFEVLKGEFVVLLGSVSVTKQSLESFVLPNNFFVDNTSISGGNSISTDYSRAPLADNFDRSIRANNIKDNSFIGVSTLSKNNSSQNFHKGQNNKKTATPNIFSEKKTYGSVLIKKTSRQTVIIDLLKKKKEIMIKDVSAVIKNCSEKTLQRELLSMVEQGILKKEGERRWSKYSLA